MHKFFQHLLLFEKFEIRSRRPKGEILKRLRDLTDPEYTDYYGSVDEDGFFIAEKNRKHFFGGHSQNSFAPVATGTVTEQDGEVVVKGTVRLHMLLIILFAPIYFLCMLTIVLFPFVYLFMYFAFVRPAKRLIESLEYRML